MQDGLGELPIRTKELNEAGRLQAEGCHDLGLQPGLCQSVDSPGFSFSSFGVRGPRSRVWNSRSRGPRSRVWNCESKVEGQVSRVKGLVNMPAKTYFEAGQKRLIHHIENLCETDSSSPL